MNENGTRTVTVPTAQALRINDLAPDFIARTTQGDVRLSQFRGQWVVLFSHPADFTPVCTSEFVSLARRAGEFQTLNCALLGLSVDSLFSHLAWLADIHSNFGVQVPFPVIEDPSMAIARAYGMLDEASPGSATVRATFVIDPEGVVRAISWYPMSVGRSVDELLRLVQALQASDAEQALTPAGWQPGEAMLSSTPLTLDQALEREGPSPWYYQEKEA